TAATGALKGPLHGGANEAVMEALEEIGSVEGVEAYVQGVLSRPGGRVMGFGHRVYRVLDPRAQVLKEVSRRLAEESGDSKWFEMSLEMERVMEREMEKRGKQVRPNVDFFSASVYRMLGFPADMYTPIFAVARIAGWMAHLYEQYADNRLMRPRLVYEGPRDKRFVPIAQRGWPRRGGRGRGGGPGARRLPGPRAAGLPRGDGPDLEARYERAQPPAVALGPVDVPRLYVLHALEAVVRDRDAQGAHEGVDRGDGHGRVGGARHDHHGYLHAVGAARLDQGAEVGAGAPAGHAQSQAGEGGRRGQARPLGAELYRRVGVDERRVEDDPDDLGRVARPALQRLE